MSYGRAPLRSRPRSVPIADIDLLGRGSELGPARCVVLLGGVDKSAVEHRPADLVSQPLIVKDKFANGIRELFALPPALKPAGLLLASGGRRTRRSGSTDGA